MIASGKGGVGKSTVSALLGEALAFAGHPTLLAELDSGLRSLDVALGVTAGVLFDMGDVARGCAPADAVMQCPFCERLSLICASASNAAVDEKTISAVINALGEDYEFILLDCPAGLGETLSAAALRRCVPRRTPAGSSKKKGFMQGGLLSNAARADRKGSSRFTALTR